MLQENIEDFFIQNKNMILNIIDQDINPYIPPELDGDEYIDRVFLELSNFFEFPENSYSLIITILHIWKLELMGLVHCGGNKNILTEMGKEVLSSIKK